MKTYVISMTSALDRRDAFRRSMEPGLEWTFFDAETHLPPGYLYDGARTRQLWGRELKKGELGCYSSHVRIWEILAAGEASQAVVLEDDVVADPAFLRQLARVDFSAQGVDYLRLFAKVPAPWRRVQECYLDKYHHLVQFIGAPLGTQGYLLTRRGAQRLLSQAKRVTDPIDVYMDSWWRHGVPNLGIYPFHIYERFQPSSIGEARFADAELTKGERLAFLLARLTRKLRAAQLACTTKPALRMPASSSH